jgi:hypothetical protein
MKRKITTAVFLLLFAALGLFAQSNNSTTLQMLVNKNWVFVCSDPNWGCEKYGYKKSYTQTKQTTIVTVNGVPSSGESDFYLSNQVEASFDYSKVGDVQNGNYIITFIPDLNGESIFHVTEIVAIDEDLLILKNKHGNVYHYMAM